MTHLRFLETVCLCRDDFFFTFFWFFPSPATLRRSNHLHRLSQFCPEPIYSSKERSPNFSSSHTHTHAHAKRKARLTHSLTSLYKERLNHRPLPLSLFHSFSYRYSPRSEETQKTKKQREEKMAAFATQLSFNTIKAPVARVRTSARCVVFLSFVLVSSSPRFPFNFFHTRSPCATERAALRGTPVRRHATLAVLLLLLISPPFSPHASW